MSRDQALDNLSEKSYSRLLVQEQHDFQIGAQCAPLATGAKKMRKQRQKNVNTVAKASKMVKMVNQIV